MVFLYFILASSNIRANYQFYVSYEIASGKGYQFKFCTEEKYEASPCLLVKNRRQSRGSAARGCSACGNVPSPSNPLPIPTRDVVDEG
jgi:hypothetical protein